MTEQQYNELMPVLKQKGYQHRKGIMSGSNNDHYFYKGFEYRADNENGDPSPQYQVFILFWDWSKYPQHVGEPFGCQFKAFFHLPILQRFDLTASTEQGLEWFERQVCEVFEMYKEKTNENSQQPQRGENIRISGSALPGGS